MNGEKDDPHDTLTLYTKNHEKAKRYKVMFDWELDDRKGLFYW